MTATTQGTVMFRIWAYLQERHPPAKHIPLAVLLFLGVAGFARAVHGEATPLASVHSAIGIASVFALFLILRLMDEIKDRDLDLELFPERPMPAARIFESDIVLLLAATIGFYIAANIVAGPAIWSALLVLGYAFLMFVFFFVPEILRRRPILNLATHNPIFALIALYGFGVFAAEHGHSPLDLDWAMIGLYTVMVWMPFLAWEIARKLRPPGSRDPYDIYSPVLGRRGAIATVALVQAIAVGIGTFLYIRLSLPAAYLAILLIAGLLCSGANLRFLMREVTLPKELGAAAEIFVAAILAAQIVGFALPAPGVLGS